MTGLPGPYILVDLDCLLSPDVPKCDFICVSDHGGLVAVVELKSGGISATDVVKQLQAGADVVDRLVCRRSRVQLRPILASGNLHKKERNDLRRKNSRINLRGANEFVQRIRCGDPLVDALRR